MELLCFFNSLNLLVNCLFLPVNQKKRETTTINKIMMAIKFDLGGASTFFSEYSGGNIGSTSTAVLFLFLAGTVFFSHFQLF